MIFSQYARYFILSTNFIFLLLLLLLPPISYWKVENVNPLTALFCYFLSVARDFESILKEFFFFVFFCIQYWMWFAKNHSCNRFHRDILKNKWKTILNHVPERMLSTLQQLLTIIRNILIKCIWLISFFIILLAFFIFFNFVEKKRRRLQTAIKLE